MLTHKRGDRTRVVAALMSPPERPQYGASSIGTTDISGREAAPILVLRDFGDRDGRPDWGFNWGTKAVPAALFSVPLGGAPNGHGTQKFLRFPMMFERHNKPDPSRATQSNHGILGVVARASPGKLYQSVAKAPAEVLRCLTFDHQVVICAGMPRVSCRRSCARL
jgi:hypothetical protein